MIPASPLFQTCEARVLGAQPVVYITLLPYTHDNGMDAGGTFLECAYIDPDEIRADYHGFALGYWISPQMAANLGRYPSPAVITWDWNSPGFEMAVFWRSARTLAALDAAGWTEVVNGDTVQLYAFYQYKVEWRGYRAWTLPAGGTPDAFTAYAVPGAGDPLDSYAAPVHHHGDKYTYLKDVLLSGEFPVAEADVEQAGRLTLEKPEAFGDLVAGDHTGLVLNNRQGRWDTRGPNFVFKNEPDWHKQKKMVRVELGYLPPGRRTPELITLYLGLLGDLGPRNRAADEAGKLQAHTAEIYSKNWITALMEHKIGLPDADGEARPLYYGEVLAEAQRVSGKALVPPLRSADFEDGTFNGLDRSVTSGGGTLSLITASPLKGDYSLRAAVAGANQTAQAVLDLGKPKTEIFTRFSWRFQAVPETIVDNTVYFWSIQDAAGSLKQIFFPRPDGKIWLGNVAGWTETGLNLLAYTGVRVEVAIWAKGGSSGQVRLWINGDEVLKFEGDLSGQTYQRIAAGAQTWAGGGAWTVDLDNIQAGDKYHDQAYQVPGALFQAIKTVYVDKIARAGSYIEKFPALGAVNFLPDPSRPDEKDVSGTVELRLTANAVSHPADVIAALITAAGAAAYMDAASFAAAKAATPNYVVGCRFEDMTAAEAIAEICSRCLYWLFVDSDRIRLVAYTGAALGAPALTINTSEAREITATTRLTDLKTRVVAKWGWQERNPDLTYTAGDPQGEGEEIDLTWQSPVATDNEVMARRLADLYLTRLGAKEDVDPVRLTLRGARLEMDDVVRVEDSFQFTGPQDHETIRKEINLDVPRETILQQCCYL